MSMKVELSEEAVNCLRHWQNHHAYSGTFSDVIVDLMHECLCRDMTTATGDEIDKELDSIERGL